MKQNNSTSGTENESRKKVNRRSKTKHPALQKKYNLKMRQDYIEPDYVNGTFNAKGEMVMRPLNYEEKTFLNAFYEEVIGANFMHDEILRELHRAMKPLKAKSVLDEEEHDDLMRLQIEYYMRADEVLLYSDSEDQKKLYGENNARNRCVYNRSKSIGILDELNDETYDEFHRNVYNDPNSGENLMISLVEPRIKKTILRKKKSKDNQET